MLLWCGWCWGSSRASPPLWRTRCREVPPETRWVRPRVGKPSCCPSELYYRSHLRSSEGKRGSWCPVRTHSGDLHTKRTDNHHLVRLQCPSVLSLHDLQSVLQSCFSLFQIKHVLIGHCSRPLLRLWRHSHTRS